MAENIQEPTLFLSELPLSLRFILKTSAFLAHHKHLKPSEGFNFIIPIPMIALEWFHSIVGLVLFILLVRVVLTSFKRYFNRWKENGFSWRYILGLKKQP